MRMIRTKDWKLVLHLKKPAQHELYDLRQDPGEGQNLYGASAVSEIQNDLRQKLHTWMQQNGAEEIRQFTKWKQGTNP